MTDYKTLQDEILGAIGEAEVRSETVKSEVQTEWPEDVIELSSNEKLFSELFGWEPTHGDFGVKTFTGYDTPKRINYIWPREETEMFVRGMQMGLKSRLVGPPGTGKTTMPQQVAAVTGRPCTIISFNSDLEVSEVVGEVRLEGGNTRFMDGVLTKAMATPAIVAFDEYSGATGAMTLCLQRFTDTLELFVAGKLSDEGDDVLVAHEDFVLCATDNTLGLGDDLDKYGARNVLDTSTLNRWGICIPLGYADEATEQAFIKSEQPDLSDRIAKELSKVSALFHIGFDQGEIAAPFSMRNLKVIAALTMKLKDPVAALEWSYLNTLDTDSKAAAREIIRTVFGK